MYFGLQKFESPEVDVHNLFCNLIFPSLQMKLDLLFQTINLYNTMTGFYCLIEIKTADR